jgi:uracil-DNA glycosylase
VNAMQSAPTAEHFLKLWRWHQVMGADALVGETPGQWLRPAKNPQANSPISQPQIQPAPHPEPPIGNPRDLACAVQNLDELRAAIAAFDGLSIKKTATQMVFADGNPKARVMVLGEAPGAEEDRSGQPFVGPAGQLLDKMLAAIQLDRQQVFISNVVHYRPPNNRPPSPDEIVLSLPFVLRMVELVRPEFLVCLGGVALKALFDTKDGIMKLRGTWRDLPLPDGTAIPTLLTYHPAFLLRTPSYKREAWADLQSLRARLDAASKQ